MRSTLAFGSALGGHQAALITVGDGTASSAMGLTWSVAAPISITAITNRSDAEGSTVSLQVTGKGGVPATGVSAVVVNVTATEAAALGYVTVWPSGVRHCGG